MIPIPPLAGPRALEALGPYDAAFFKELKCDGLVKSPSVLLGAGLRFNFVVAAYLLVRFTPQFLRALDVGASGARPFMGVRRTPLQSKPSFR